MKGEPFGALRKSLCYPTASGRTIGYIVQLCTYFRDLLLNPSLQHRIGAGNQQRTCHDAIDVFACDFRRLGRIEPGLAPCMKVECLQSDDDRPDTCKPQPYARSRNCQRVAEGFAVVVKSVADQVK